MAKGRRAFAPPRRSGKIFRDARGVTISLCRRTPASRLVFVDQPACSQKSTVGSTHFDLDLARARSSSMRISEAQDAYHVALAAEDCIDPAREKAWNSSSYQDQTTFAAFGGASASTTTENLLLGDSGDKNLALLSFPDDARHRSQIRRREIVSDGPPKLPSERSLLRKRAGACMRSPAWRIRPKSQLLFKCQPVAGAFLKARFGRASLCLIQFGFPYAVRAGASESST